MMCLCTLPNHAVISHAVNMNMASFRIADFKGCQRSEIRSISLFKADLFIDI